MKKRNLITVLMMTAALAAGCGAKAETTTAAPTQAETTKAETTQAMMHYLMILQTPVPFLSWCPLGYVPGRAKSPAVQVPEPVRSI